MCRHYIQGIPVPLTLSYPQTQQSFYSHCMLIPSSPSVPSTLFHPSLVFSASLTHFLLLFLTHYRPPTPFILLLPLLLIPPFPLLSSQDTKSKPRPQVNSCKSQNTTRGTFSTWSRVTWTRDSPCLLWLCIWTLTCHCLSQSHLTVQRSWGQTGEWG